MTNNIVSLRYSHSRHENDTPLRHRFCNMYSVTLLWHKNVLENVHLIQGFSLASFRNFPGKIAIWCIFRCFLVKSLAKIHYQKTKSKGRYSWENTRKTWNTIYCEKATFKRKLNTLISQSRIPVLILTPIWNWSGLVNDEASCDNFIPRIVQD